MILLSSNTVMVLFNWKFLKYPNQKALNFKFQEIFFGISCSAIAATTTTILAVKVAATLNSSCNACLVVVRAHYAILHYSTTIVRY